MQPDTEAMVAGLSRWVETESPTGDRDGVNRVLDLIAEAVATEPVKVERLPGRDGLGDILILRAGPENVRPGPLVLSHVDTVHPLGTLARDLPLRRDADRLYGPGIYDMKGGAYLALEAFRHVARTGTAPAPMSFIFTPDEEIGSPTSRTVIEDEARRHGCVLVTEPAREGGKVVTARKGVGRFDVHVEGRPAHSGTRHADGRSAVLEAARQIVDLEGMTDYSAASASISA
jgi:glutamate carboxypeptidase